MLTDLRSYYNAKGISAEGFNCPHQGACRSISEKFITAREAFVGSEYEKGTLPRVLFISLDASSDHPGGAPSQRTLQHMRFSEELDPNGCDPEKLHRLRHWYWTHKFAYELLNPVALTRLGSPLEFRHIHKYFAHTNSAKCKDAARGSSQGPAIVFNNCREFLPMEIRLLRPDVIVTQGKWARLAVEGAFPVNARSQQSQHLQYGYEIITVDHRPVLNFSTYHQNNYGKFNDERKLAYPWYFQVAREFLAEK